MVRKTVQLQTKEELRPVATPVRSGYVSRDVPSLGAANALAEALSSLQPSLSRFARKQAEETQKSDVAAGEALYALQENRQSWSDFVKANPEHAGANPWVREGYLRARMANEAANYRTWLQAQSVGENAVVQDGEAKIGLAEANPDQTAKWLQQQKMRYIKENMGGVMDPGLYSEIFTPLAESAERELSSKIISYQQDALIDKSIGEHSKLIENTLRGAIESGAFDGPESEQAKAHIGTQISTMAREMIRDGIPPQQVNAAVVDTLLALADDNDVEDADEILSLAQHVETSKGSYLGNIPAIKKQFEQAIDAKNQENYWKNVQAEQMRKQKEAEAKRIDDTQLASVYIDNPLSVPKKTRLAYIQKYGMDNYTDLIRSLKTMDSYNDEASGGKGGGSGSDKIAAQMWFRIATNDMPTPQEIMNAGMSKTETINLLKTVSTKTAKEENKLWKDYGSLVENAVFTDLYATKNPDELPGEAQVFAYQVAEEAALAVEDEVKKTPDIADNPQKMRVLVRQKALEFSEKYRKQMDKFTDTLRMDPNARITKVDPAAQNNAMQSTLALAADYQAQKASGADVKNHEFAQLVERKYGGAKTPEQVLEALRKKGQLNDPLSANGGGGTGKGW